MLICSGIKEERHQDRWEGSLTVGGQVDAAVHGEEVVDLPLRFVLRGEVLGRDAHLLGWLVDLHIVVILVHGDWYVRFLTLIILSLESYIL